MATNGVGQIVHGETAFAVSSRASRALGSAPNYIKLFNRIVGSVMMGKEKFWSMSDRSGYIFASIAENRVSVDLILERLGQCKPLDPRETWYLVPTGSDALKASICKMMKATCMKGVEFEQRNVVASAGTLSVLDLLLYILTEAGDHVIMVAPHYSMFENILKGRNDLHGARWYPDLSAPMGPQLDSVKSQAEQKGGRVRALLLSNPDNPTGELMSDDMLLEILTWGGQHGVHIVSDELYANSLFDRSKQFTSMGHVLQTHAASLPPGTTNLVHIVNGISKDWAVAGFRLGYLVTWNAKVLTAYNSPLSSPVQVSSQTQANMAEIFDDLAFVHNFLDASAALVERNYRLVARTLDEHNVRRSNCKAAVFVWIDLRHMLSEPTWEAELGLQERLISEAKVLLSNGQSLFAYEPGYFRICYACLPYAAVEELCSRLGKFFSQSVIN